MIKLSDEKTCRENSVRDAAFPPQVEQRLDDFSFLESRCWKPHGHSKLHKYRARVSAAVYRVMPTFASGALASLLRNVGDVGLGKKEETFLLLSCFHKAHVTVLDAVSHYWRPRGAADLKREVPRERVGEPRVGRFSLTSLVNL